MNLKIAIDLEDRKLFKLYDVTTNSLDIPPEIWSYTLEVSSSRMPNGRLPYSLDIIAYLNSQMIQNEIYTLSSGDLGFPENIDIPDGVYHFDYTMNNVITKHATVLVYQNVKRRVTQLLIDANYKVDVLSNSWKYLNDEVNSKYDIETVRYAKVLMDALEMYAITQNEIEVNDILDKLERLLLILKIQ